MTHLVNWRGLCDSGSTIKSSGASGEHLKFSGAVSSPQNDWLLSQSCLTLCNPMDYSPPGFSILLARILEWVAISSSEDLPNPETEPKSFMFPELAGRFFTTSATGEAVMLSSVPM